MQTIIDTSKPKISEGWVLFKSTGHNFWHFMYGDSATACRPNKQNVIANILEWRPASDKAKLRRFALCPRCLSKLDKFGNKPDPRGQAPYVPLMLVEPSEPEILTLTKDEESVMQPQTSPTDTAETGMSVAEVAELLDIKPNTIYFWGKYSKKSNLHYKDGRFPAEDLPRLEMLAKKFHAKNGTKQMSKTQPVAQAPAVLASAGPSLKDAPPAKTMIALPHDALYLASLMGKSENEFISWCVAQMCQQIKERLSKT